MLSWCEWGIILKINNAYKVYCSYLGQQLCRQTFFHLEEPREKKLFKEAVETRSLNKKRETPNVYQYNWLKKQVV